MSTAAKIALPADDVAARWAPGSTLTSRVAALLPRIAELAPETERNRRVSDEIIEALRQAGMWRVYVPREYGGTEESILEVVRAIRMVATVCASTAWVIGVLCAHPFITSLYSRKVQDEFWASGPDTLASTSGLPITRARIVDGGLRITGRFPFSSGSVNASWAMVGVSAPDLSQKNSERFRTPYFCLVPRTDYDIEDNWHVMGLAGTASRDLVFDDVFVPSYRIEMSAAMTNRYTKGEGLHQGPLWNAGYGATIGTALTPVFLGLADAILAAVTRRVQGRTVPGTRIPTNSVPNSMRLSESTLELRACTLLWEDYIKRIEDRAAAGILPDEDFIANAGATNVYVQELATRTIDRLFAVAGGSSIRLDNPIQRMWRDAHAGRSHIANEYDPSAQAFGRHILGLPAGGRWGG
ncbi:MAG TPA: acyl-CoA dehydrogenase family protein [Sphingomonadaceae bacterium]|nr:acyl-CoA dehydrogenase family protein [Sphingomonadaceae bacterium]